MKLGICDWGIGGAGIYTLLREKVSTDVVYVSDTGYLAYGKVPEATLKERLQVVFRYLREQGCEKIMVGCNAASTVLEPNPDIIGVIEHGVNMVVKNRIKEIAVVGGQRTIESGIYRSRLEANGIVVHQQVAQPLSGRIEAGDIHSEGMKEDIRAIFGPIRSMQHILLACTHYPLITRQIAAFTGNTHFLDPAEEMVNWILQNWQLPEGNSYIEWHTTGDTEQMKSSLELLYNHVPLTLKKIYL